jgi:hypothetical protein
VIWLFPLNNEVYLVSLADLDPFEATSIIHSLLRFCTAFVLKHCFTFIFRCSDIDPFEATSIIHSLLRFCIALVLKQCFTFTFRCSDLDPFETTSIIYSLLRFCTDLVLKQCFTFTFRCSVNCNASMHFGENQLVLDFSSISPLTTTKLNV